MYIFIDESGDLGSDLTKKGTSKTFTLSMLVCDDNKTANLIKYAIKKTIKRKLSNKKGHCAQELKGSATKLEIKKFFLDLMPDSGWVIHSITADKGKLKTSLEKKNGKSKLYNFLTCELLKTFSPEIDLSHVSVVIDASKNSSERKDFNAYIKTHLELSFGLDVSIYITHENSHNNTGLQAIDLFCWGIQRKYNHGCIAWFNLFEHKIKANVEYPVRSILCHHT